MKRWLLAILTLLVVVGLSGAPAQAQNVNNFSIRSFEADYYLSRDDDKVASMRVVEKISAQFPEYDQNHGILRSLPEKYEGNSLSLQVEAVTDFQNNPYQYTTYSDSDNLVLRIGDPDRYARGITNYLITYTVKNVATFYDNHVELFWDVNGDEWSQNFGSVNARIHLPRSLATKLQEQQRCFTGSFGSTEQGCSIKRTTTAQGAIINITADNQLQPAETLSFVLAFDSGTFEPDKHAEFLKKIFLILVIGGVLLPPLLTVAMVVWIWSRKGRDPEGRGVIVPQYQAPKNVDIVTADTVLNEKLNYRTISAALIGLATDGYVVIHETKIKKLFKDKTDYEIELIKKPKVIADNINDVIALFFGKSHEVGDKVKISQLSKKLYTQVQKLKKDSLKRAADSGYYAKDPVVSKKPLRLAAIISLICGFLIMFTGIGIPLGIGMIISSLILFFGASKMPVRTVKGVELKEYLIGLKDYMNLAEADRLKFLQSVKGAERIGTSKKARVKLFEDLLPYAIMFGIEKSWAKEFQDIYEQPPDWYRGNWTTFNTVYLTSSLNDFSSSSSSSFSPPTSSGSSGFSSGGGFSGGGGGGGGGGGW